MPAPISKNYKWMLSFNNSISRLYAFNSIWNFHSILEHATKKSGVLITSSERNHLTVKILIKIHIDRN